MKIRRLGGAALVVAAIAVPTGAHARESGFIVSAQTGDVSAPAVYWGPPHLFRLSAEGTDAKQLTDLPVSDFEPTVTPDGKIYFTRWSGSYVCTIAICAPVDGQSDIWRMELDGSGAEPVTRTPNYNEWGPAASDDGRYVAYERWAVAGAASAIAVHDRELGTETAFSAAPAKSVDTVSWTPDSQQLVFRAEIESGIAFAIANRDGSGRRILYELEGMGYEPALSPDGTRIAYALPEGDNQAIAVVNLDGSNNRVLVPARAYNWAPGWSPDASLVHFTRPSGGASRIYTVKPDGTDARPRGKFAEWALAAAWFGPRPATFPPLPGVALDSPKQGAPAAAAAPPVRVLTRTVRPDRRGRARLRISCQSGSRCRGRVVLALQQGPPRTIGSRVISIAPRRTATVSVRLAAAAQRQLRARRSLTVRARFLDKQGTHELRSLRLRHISGGGR